MPRKKEKEKESRFLINDYDARQSIISGFARCGYPVYEQSCPIPNTSSREYYIFVGERRE
jgi:hypothetical protein